MRAVVYTRYGSPDVLRLQDVPRPEPKDNEARIRVHATTVNRTDCGFRQPEYFIIRFFNGMFRPRINILGNEFAGVIDTVGKDVDSFREGDRVFGLTGSRFGAHAEYLCMPEDGPFAPIPENFGFEEAAAVCDGAMLANTYLRNVNLRSGHRILIYGASGSIGTAGVQLAKYFGAEVTAVCSPKGLDTVSSLGADTVIDYTKEDFTKNGVVYDFIFDAVGKHSFLRCKNSLVPKGKFFATDFAFLMQNPALTLLTAPSRGRKVVFPLPKERKEDILFFKELIEAGKYKAVIDRRYPLDRIVEATKYVEQHQKIGNVVITI